MFNPAKASENIKNDFINYLTSSFYISDDEYREQFTNKLKNSDGISKGPFVHIQQPFETGESISNLINKNILCKEFLNLEKCDENQKALKLERGLYKHQVNAINVITTNKHNAVITTGTGSGKTECFLIPVLNELLKEKEEGTLSVGVRAILIYPMNALAHDQIKRLREILKEYPDITFGVYNGNTKNKQSEAKADYIDANGTEPPVNELISRETMNVTPPHILCTNYAMLEHMLLKPDNAKIFNNNDFKFVILDEAHVYSGATGMENALLLRRLKARISRGRKIQFILTSATLGKKGKDEQSIIDFAKSLTGEDFEKEDIVFGTRKTPDFSTSKKEYNSKLFSELANSESENHKNILESYGLFNSKIDIEENYYEVCKSFNLFEELCKIEEPLQEIKELADTLIIPINDLINYLNIVCLATKNGIPLLDLKYHFFIRGLEGIYSPLVGKKKIIFEKKESEGKIRVFERAICRNCGNLGITGVIKKNLADGIDYLEQSSKFEEANYFSIFDISENNNVFFEEDINDIPDEENDVEEKEKDESYRELKICPQCGAISEVEEELMCDCNIASKKIVYKNDGCRCAKCKSGNMQKVFTNQENSTSILATSLFDNIPSKKASDKDKYENIIQWDGGKQFLCFSDSRSDAAFFAPYLSNYQGEFIWKRAIIEALNKIDEEIEIEDFVEIIKKIFKKKESFKNDLSEEESKSKKINVKNAYAAIANELINSRDKNSLMSYGLIDFKIDNRECAKLLSDYFKIEYNKCLKLLDYLIMFFAWNGCIKIDELEDEIDISDNLKEYLFYTLSQKMICKQNKSSNNYGIGWMAKPKPGKTTEFYDNSRTEIVERVLGFDTVKANEFLEKYLECLVKERIIKQDNRKLEHYYLPFENFIVCSKDDVEFFKCDKCGKITTHNLDGKCNEHNCGGKLIKTNYRELFENNEFSKIYNNNNFKHMLIKEHTAQLSNKEGHEYQKMFEKNKIHALSCSTTFEMGVDVGKLETVFLRNIPPTAANYAQRAGRAGRSKDAASYCLCFAKLSSHDYNYFNEPKDIIIGDIKPPIFKIDNEKIVERHIYAIMFGYFFQLYPDFFKAKHFLIKDEKGVRGYDVFKEMLKECPTQLSKLIKDSIPNFEGIEKYRELLTGSNGVLENSIIEFSANIKELEKLKKEAAKAGKTSEEKRYLNMLEDYTSVEIIDFLVTNNVIPKYGFPIDSVQLKVRGEKAEKSLNLARDLALAISEYAPGENVIANGKVYESRYVNKIYINDGKKPKMTFFKRKIGYCSNCETYNYFDIDTKDYTCNVCGEKISFTQSSVVPKRGFTSSTLVKPVKMRKPDRKYSSQGHYIPDERVNEDKTVEINGIEIELKTTKNDRIMNVSNDDFYICDFCGYAVSKLDKKEFGSNKDAYKDVKNGKKIIELSHKGLDHKSCSGHLYKNRLIDIYNTDVLVMNFDDSHSPQDHNEALSILYALLDAMSNVLSIERSDINGTLFVKFEDGSFKGFQLVFYDTVPGGAGNVKLLLKDDSKIKEIFISAYRKLNKCKCSKSCYNCLNNYSNQKYHDDLDRTLALEFIKKFI